MIGLLNYLTGDLLSLAKVFTFHIPLFEFAVLPIIIFESGYSLKKNKLFRNWVTILLYAVLGTFFNAIFIGMTVYVVSLFWPTSLGGALVDTSNPFEGLLFGSIVSATDPVATLAILGTMFSSQATVPRVYTLIFGESIINDAVAIVLYRYVCLGCCKFVVLLFSNCRLLFVYLFLACLLSLLAHSLSITTYLKLLVYSCTL